jgi:type VI secretion system Hcp family effector
VAALLGFPWFVIDSEATISIFLKLDGEKLKGESRVKGHEGEIDVLAMSFGASSGATVLTAGQPNVSDIGVTKYTDLATPDLMLHLLNGEHIPSARFGFYESDLNGKEHPVVTFQLNDVLVTAHSPGGSGGEDRLTERISLNFKEFTCQTFSYSATTGAVSANPSVTWDNSTNTGSGTGGGTNTVPTITNIASQSTPEDTGITIPFTVGDAETATGSLGLSRSTSNPLVVPLESIVFGGSGSSRSVTITPAANASGSATVGITVTDGGGLTTTTGFTFTVTPVNDPPTIPAIANQVTDFGTALAVPLNVGDIDTAAASVTVSATSANPALIPAGNITFSGSGASTVMTLTPAAGVSGSSLITLTANDGAANSTPVVFTFTVNPAGNNGPTNIQWSGAGNPVPLVPENSATNTAVGTLVTTDPDDGNNVTYTLLNSAGGRFKLGTLGAILVDNGLLLDFETAASHQITVRATDPAQNTYDKILSISLVNVNEAPVIATLPPGNFLEGATAPVAGITLADPDSGASAITATFGVAGGILHLDDSGTLSGKVTGNNSATVTATASITAINAVLSSGGLSYNATGVPPAIYPLAIEANDLGNTGTGGAKNSSTTVNLAVLASRFNLWRQSYFNSAQLADTSISGPLADFDKDGVANLLEYGVGSSPTNPADGPGLVEFIRENVNGTIYPAVRFKRLKPQLETALQIQVEIATDNFNWRVDPADVIPVSSTPLDANRDTVVIRSVLPLNGEARQMMRLRFTLAP